MRNKQSGFTLLELMITVAIVSIVASIALWNSGSMLEENRAENFLLELKRNISYARSQAASTDEVVIVCPVLAKSAVDLKCTNEWGKEHSVIVFIDKITSQQDYNNKTATYKQAEDDLLRMMEKVSLSDKIKFTGSEVMLRFNTSGRITTNPGDFVYCPNDGTVNNKALTVSQSGTAFYSGETSKNCA